VEPPSNGDWTIECSRGTKFWYSSFDDQRPLYNPCFSIFFRGRLVAVIHATVYRSSTSYTLDWNHRVLEGIAQVGNLDMIAESRDLSPDMYEFILDFLIGERMRRH
jgi:hypothetical protein